MRQLSSSSAARTATTALGSWPGSPGLDAARGVAELPPVQVTSTVRTPSAAVTGEDDHR